jgi:transcriptional regulator GlxA family with amidase domain
MQIQTLIFDGFDELDLVGSFETLKMADLSVKVVSLRQQEVVAANGLKIVADDVLDFRKAPDILLVPGGGWLNRAPQGAWFEAEQGDILPILKSFHEAGTVLAAVCTGVLLLGRAGLLRDRPATTNHSALTELNELGAKIINARVVDDGDIITAGGITSSIDLGLWIIERFAGEAMAAEVSSKLEFTRRPPLWHDGKIILHHE